MKKFDKFKQYVKDNKGVLVTSGIIGGVIGGLVFANKQLTNQRDFYEYVATDLAKHFCEHEEVIEDLKETITTLEN